MYVYVVYEYTKNSHRICVHTHCTNIQRICKLYRFTKYAYIARLNKKKVCTQRICVNVRCMDTQREQMLYENIRNTERICDYTCMFVLHDYTKKKYCVAR